MRDRDAQASALAERILAYERETGTGAAATATAERICSKLRDSLGQFIGEAGVMAVLVHAARITRAQFPFIQVEETPGQGECLVALADSLNGEDPAHVEAGLVALIVNSCSVLYSLLGSELTHRLLDRIWPDIDAR